MGTWFYPCCTSRQHNANCPSYTSRKAWQKRQVLRRAVTTPCKNRKMQNTGPLSCPNNFEYRQVAVSWIDSEMMTNFDQVLPFAHCRVTCTPYQVILVWSISCSQIRFHQRQIESTMRTRSRSDTVLIIGSNWLAWSCRYVVVNAVRLQLESFSKKTSFKRFAMLRPQLMYFLSCGCDLGASESIIDV